MNRKGRQKVRERKRERNRQGEVEMKGNCKTPTYKSVFRNFSLLMEQNKCYRATVLFPVQFSSVQSLSRVLLCNPMNFSMPGLPVHHQLLEFTQTHVHRVSDAIQPSHPLLSPSPPAPNPSDTQAFKISPMSPSEDVAVRMRVEKEFPDTKYCRKG